MIKPEDVCKKSLKELIAKDEEGLKEFERTHNLVKMILFSRYPKRKEYATRLLKKCGVIE